MNIKKVINKKGWSVSALAAEMPNRDGTKGIKQSSMSRIINGNPTIDTLKDLAKIIGVSLSELVADDNDQQGTSLTWSALRKTSKYRIQFKGGLILP